MKKWVAISTIQGGEEIYMPLLDVLEMLLELRKYPFSVKELEDGTLQFSIGSYPYPVVESPTMPTK